MFKVIFLGTGVSTATPSIYHCIQDNFSCKVCKEAYENLESKNRRNNVSIAIVFDDKTDGSKKCVMVDAGKTMRDSLLRIFPKHGIKEVAGILLTHGNFNDFLFQMLIKFDYLRSR